MTPDEIEDHVECVLQIGEGIIDLHSSSSDADFLAGYAMFLTQLIARASQELTRVTNETIASTIVSGTVSTALALTF